MRPLVLLLLFLLADVGPAAAQLRGRVLDLQTGSGVVNASVRLLAGAREHETFTDASGAYDFRAIPAAEYWLLVRHPGYEGVDLRVVIRSGGDVVLDVPLEVQPIPVARVFVPISRTVPRGGAEGSADSLLTEMEREQNQALRNALPAALHDMVQAESREPQPDPGGGASHTLHVWGAASERGRVMLDGATVNAPLHLGAILPPVEPELLASAELRTGGSPARYDGGTNYIVEYVTRPAAPRLRTWGEAGLLTSRLGVEAPLDNGGSVGAAFRRVNDEAVDALIDGAFEYAYDDALLRTEVRTGERTSFRALALGTRETVRIPRDLADDEASWRNVATVVSWGVDRPDAGPRLVASYSRGIVDLPLLSAPDGHLKATFDRAAFTASHGWRSGAAGFTTGLELEHLWLKRRSTASSDPLDPETPGPVACTFTLPCATAAATTVAAFGDASWQPTRRIAMHAGVRASVAEDGDETHLLPRFALTWLGSGTTTATLSVGRYSQVGVLESTPGVAAAAISELLTPTRLATQYELRIAHRGRSLALEASGFLRRQHVPGTFDESEFVPGAELSWALVHDRSSVSGGYSLLARAATSDSALDRQHLVFVSAGTGKGPLQFDVAGVYGAGVPLTSIVLDRPQLFEGGGDPPSGSRLEDGPYMRVDAVLSGDWTLRVRGRPVHVTPYAKLINAFTRRGALFYYREGSASELQPLSALPTMPVLGVRWSF